jgi:glyoxylase-like metal-dependent hydrolase (beta-lactamase superfamily II)
MGTGKLLRGRPTVKPFFEKRTCSVQYVVADAETRRAVVIDPVLDFDPRSGTTSTRSADEILGYIKREGLILDWVLDTHPLARSGLSLESDDRA